MTTPEQKLDHFRVSNWFGMSFDQSSDICALENEHEREDDLHDLSGQPVPPKRIADSGASIGDVGDEMSDY